MCISDPEANTGATPSPVSPEATATFIFPSLARLGDIVWFSSDHAASSWELYGQVAKELRPAAGGMSLFQVTLPQERPDAGLARIEDGSGHSYPVSLELLTDKQDIDFCQYPKNVNAGDIVCLGLPTGSRPPSDARAVELETDSGGLQLLPVLASSSSTIYVQIPEDLGRRSITLKAGTWVSLLVDPRSKESNVHHCSCRVATRVMDDPEVVDLKRTALAALLEGRRAVDEKRRQLGDAADPKLLIPAVKSIKAAVVNALSPYAGLNGLQSFVEEKFQGVADSLPQNAEADRRRSASARFALAVEAPPAGRAVHQSIWERLEEILRSISSRVEEQPVVILQIRSSPEGATFTMKPPLFERPRYQAWTNIFLKNVFIGLYVLDLKKEGFDSILYPVDLMNDLQPTLECDFGKKACRRLGGELDESAEVKSGR